MMAASKSSFSPDELGTFKTCTKCSISKPLAAYYRNAVRPDGHEAVCIDCRNNRLNTWQQLKETVDKLKLIKKVTKRATKAGGEPPAPKKAPKKATRRP